MVSVLLVVLSLCSANNVWARGKPCSSAATCRDELVLSTGVIPYYRSLAFVRSAAVQRAIIVVHGNQRDAYRYFDYVVAAARLEKHLDDVLLLAPNFRTLDDHPAANEHYWSSGGWKIGDRSRDPKRVSSFAVMNELLARVCPDEPVLFPNLRTVVIIGHSAGGQFVSRYLAGGGGCRNAAVEVRYVAMNPSSYLYVDGRRKSGRTGRFEYPGAGCPNYDEYKYGLDDLNAYMKRIGPDRIRAQLFKRHSYFLSGEADVGTGGSLDTACQANLQGANRLERYRNYREYTGLFAGWTGASFVSVPGIGHQGGKMLMSGPARRIMFH